MVNHGSHLEVRTKGKLIRKKKEALMIETHSMTFETERFKQLGELTKRFPWLSQGRSNGI